MRYKNLIWMLVLMLLASPVLVVAQTSQTIRIQSSIKDTKGTPIASAFILTDEEEVLGTTNENGEFDIQITPNSLLIFRAEGFESKVVRISGQTEEIILVPEWESRRVNTAFQSKDRSNLMGGVSFVNIPELLEKNYFTWTLDNMEGFAPGFHGNIWGNNEYLLLVDGVPRDPGSVMPIEIEQITFLKGVSAVALYGSRAAKGVIMVTTKRGSVGKQTINVRANTGVHAAREIPKYLGSAEYMTLFNEARVNDGLQPLFSQEEIFNHGSGSNPYRYPNLDFYSNDYLQKAYSRHDATMEIAGGNDRARYYTNLGMMSEGSLLNFGQAAQNRNERFNVRGNVDMNLTNFISGFADAAVIFYNGRGVNTDFWQGAATIRPNRFSPLVPISMIEGDDAVSQNFIQNSSHLIGGQYLLGGTQLEQTNPIADIYAGGSNVFTSRQYQFNTGVNADLRNIAEGLTFNYRFGLDYQTSYVLAFNNEYAVYQPQWNNYAGQDLITGLTRFRQDASTRTQNISGNRFQQTMSMSAQLNYNTVIDEKHEISAMLIASGFQTGVSQMYHRVSNANLGIHLGYNYQNRFLAEFNGAIIHSARLPEQNRRAFSPTGSLGWRLSNEGFLKNSSVVNNLLVSVSGGIVHTDLDIMDYYLYEQVFTQQGDGTVFYTWKDGLNNITTISRRGANPGMRFPKREEVNIGVEGSFFNNKVYFNGSAFISRMTGLLVQRSDIYPTYFATGFPASSFIPFENYNADQRTGFDFNLNVKEKVGAVNLNIGLVGTYYATKAIQRGENWLDEYQVREGRPIDGIWGLRNAGFFNSSAQIGLSPTQIFGEVAPGDIRYIDQNGDDRITPQDEVFLGRGGWFGAPLTMGLNVTAQWKNFTFFALGMWRSGAHAMRNSSYFWISGDAKYSEVVRDRWTPATAETAEYPRLTTLNGANNFRNSDFWLYSTNRFDLARVQVTYRIPADKFFGGAFIKGMDVYMNGANLLTLGPNRKILTTNIGSAPQTHFFNLGLAAQF
ncbi:SusC/RagA family TonB-linked outer membrane protein [Mongoliitalea daihaiensis]|uniref:SusC/RagA family TonB-linked outer membrane protein n=1 Tax=Mongoliitalea daihaiensis TaxID=2782006 RepID=UPI001F4428BF|nr:SusC/RagA family TonB-linked outer membrane protein [Mongoliitalea daihaiensis]UJP65084.1 SusC/RagA family TonB-linked outer membrane protein [Mongoliitalea daihaiensis]